VNLPLSFLLPSELLAIPSRCADRVGVLSNLTIQGVLTRYKLSSLRPGFGGSTPVPLSQRVAVWIEAVPLVLAKLGVKHVAVFSHSAGTIYSLNTLGQLREILDPARPYVAFIGKAYALV
jgi:pimeloyl-ACP methyl ester carboxylesterase